MSRPFAGLLIAILVTFAAAPSQAFAAANTLADPYVSPDGGMLGTVVTLAVTYDGSHPADSVTASVAGRSVPLARVSGTPESGRWSGAVVPPLGTWPVVFSAIASTGNQPSLQGPSITVVAATVVPSVDPAPGEGGTASAPATTAAPGPGPDGSGPAATQAPAEQASPTPAEPAIDPAPVATAQPAAGTGAAAPTGGNGVAPPSAADPAPPAAVEDPAPSGGLGMPAASADAASPSQRSAGSQSPLPGGDLRDRTPWLPAVMTLAVTMAALLALTGFAIWLAGRRRATDEPQVAGNASASPSQQRLRSHAANADDLGADDPIVSALGISPETALRARRARRLRDSLDGRAPAERPAELDPPRDPLRTQRRRTKRH